MVECFIRFIAIDMFIFKFFVLKLIEIVILWVYYIIPFGFSLDTFGRIFSNFGNYFVSLSTTDEGSVSEMCIWSIL